MALSMFSRTYMSSQDMVWLDWCGNQFRNSLFSSVDYFVKYSLVGNLCSILETETGINGHFIIAQGMSCLSLLWLNECIFLHVLVDYTSLKKKQTCCIGYFYPTQSLIALNNTEIIKRFLYWWSKHIGIVTCFLSWKKEGGKNPIWVWERFCKM